MIEITDHQVVNIHETTPLDHNKTRIGSCTFALGGVPASAAAREARQQRLTNPSTSARVTVMHVPNVDNNNTHDDLQRDARDEEREYKVVESKTLMSDIQK